MDRTFILNQAFEESRYHRRFHHTVYTLFMTIYIALLGFQISFTEQIEQIRAQTPLVITFVVIFLVLIPIYVLYIIVDYHKRIATINSLIANLWESKDSDIKETFSNGLNTLLFDKYKDVLAKGKNPIWIGKGQWLFLVTLFLAVAGNIIVFAVIKAPTIVPIPAAG